LKCFPTQYHTSSPLVTNRRVHSRTSLKMHGFQLNASVVCLDTPAIILCQKNHQCSFMRRLPCSLHKLQQQCPEHISTANPFRAAPWYWALCLAAGCRSCSRTTRGIRMVGNTEWGSWRKGLYICFLSCCCGAEYENMQLGTKMCTCLFCLSTESCWQSFLWSCGLMSAMPAYVVSANQAHIW